jgi:hypothetical protein
MEKGLATFNVYADLREEGQNSEAAERVQRATYQTAYRRVALLSSGSGSSLLASARSHQARDRPTALVG